MAVRLTTASRLTQEHGRPSSPLRECMYLVTSLACWRARMDYTLHGIRMGMCAVGGAAASRTMVGEHTPRGPSQRQARSRSVPLAHGGECTRRARMSDNKADSTGCTRPTAVCGVSCVTGLAVAGRPVRSSSVLTFASLHRGVEARASTRRSPRGSRRAALKQRLSRVNCE